ncbi:MAG: SPOR domain-containing protein [Candidatus Edwardsbacteria bacterium]
MSSTQSFIKGSLFLIFLILSVSSCGSKYLPREITEEKKAVTEEKPRPEEKPAVEVAPASVIWRVELFSTTVKEKVREEALKAGTALGTSVYIISEPPYYKVQAGHYNDQSEAKNLLAKAKKLGYTKAKVVEYKK